MENDSEMTHDYDIPAFIITALTKVVSKENLFNTTHLYTDPTVGVRVENNANEIAHYEYGASLVSDSFLGAMNSLKVGITEQEAGDYLQSNGFFPNVVTISAFDDRFINVNIYPTNKKLSLGDKVALTVSYRRGLSSRFGYAVKSYTELNEEDNNYYEDVVEPYYKAYLYWLDNMKLGITGGDFFKKFNDYYPADVYGWVLCPGQIVSNEE